MMKQGERPALLLIVIMIAVGTRPALVSAQFTNANYDIVGATDSVLENNILTGFSGTATVSTVAFSNIGDSYVDPVTCTAGSYAVAASSTCSQCIAGKYSTTISATAIDTCLACESGKYSATVGAQSVATCVSCGVNTYFSGTGGASSAVCVSCPSFASSYEGSKVATSCVCNPGYSGANGGVCTGCGGGVWCLNGVSNTCPNNANSAALSSTLAQCLCNPGYFGDTTMPTVQSATLCQVISSFFLLSLTPHTPYPLKILSGYPGRSV
jgi:hypothetical protein